MWHLAFAGALVATPLPAIAQVASDQLSAILNDTRSADIAPMRSACAMGFASDNLAKLRAAGVHDVPSVGAWCVTVLTRAGRDGTLGYVRDPRSTALTASLAFDSGFVRGYLDRAEVPSDAPQMTMLLPVADRCLSGSETNLRLCELAAQVLGARAAQGETVPTPK